jgi:uncharacterized protein (DUF362 family)
MAQITKRVFLKRTLGCAGSLILMNSLDTNILADPTPNGLSRVVVVKHPEATDSAKIINSTNVQTMMNESIRQLTGKSSIADSWLDILPGFSKKDIIAIKVNAIAATLPTHPDVVNTITSGLISAGVLENNIIIYDIAKQKLVDAKYVYNAGDKGIRCFGTDEQGWGYDDDNPIDILGQKQSVSKILTSCDHLINVPILKVHLDQYGVTLALKNHFGSISAPQLLHDNFHEACANLNSQKVIKDKTRLVVTDALFGFWGSSYNWVPEFAPNTLIVSKDPVTADYIGTKMLDEERANHNQPPRRVPFLKIAQDLGIGIADPERIDLINISL